jgi:hypothetical protein
MEADAQEDREPRINSGKHGRSIVLSQCQSRKEIMQPGAARTSDETPGLAGEQKQGRVAPGLGRGFHRRDWLPDAAPVGSLLTTQTSSLPP